MQASTRQASAVPDGIMEQEAAYLAVLPTAARYRLGGNSLELLSADRKRIVSYARAERQWAKED